jgi:poly(hydroxyalkanoate) depolymerase family esterase
MLCFNWFSGNDTQRGMGEAASIRSMIEAVKKAHDVDPERIFVTGLSAGGAMASVMLAAYPDVFAAGAILAGVAYGCADNVGEAFDCMGGRARSGAKELAAQVRRASPHKGPWPRVQVWQGSADHTVVPSNADALALQWTGVHGLPASPTREDQVEGHPRRLWLDATGAAVIEQISVTGMAHGVPLSGAGEDPIGQAGAHMLDVGLDSTARIAAFFGIAPEAEAAALRPAAAKATAERSRVTLAQAQPQPQATAQPASGPQAVIEKALKAAGLMR